MVADNLFFAVLIDVGLTTMYIIVLWWAIRKWGVTK